MNIKQADKINCDIITISPSILSKLKLNSKNLIQVSKETSLMFYKDVLKTLKKLRSNNIDLCIVTSKDQHRTKKILKKNIKLFKYIECDDGKLKGKPNPDKIYNIINKTNYNKRDILFVGYTYIDYLTAKNSNIDFMYIKDGYGKNFNYKNKSKNISDLQKKLLN